MKKSFTNKIIIILAVVTSAIFLEACITNCNCPTIINTHFDFGTFEIEVENEVLPLDSGLVFSLRPDAIEFVANANNTHQKECYQSFFINSAFACSCASEGFQGMKYQISELNIYSDADYTPELPAGTNLNEQIVYGHTIGGETVRLSEIENLEEFFFTFTETPFSLKIPPTEETIHTFTIQLIKSNQDTITRTSPVIIWE